MISTRKWSACVAISRWLVISVFLLIVTTASAVGVSNAADNKQANNFQMNGASNDDLRVSPSKTKPQQLIQWTKRIVFTQRTTGK